MWVGINFKTGVLSFALLYDEIVDTYKWVIEAFIEYMKCMISLIVVIDGDPLIRNVVLELMSNSMHRLSVGTFGRTLKKM